MQESKEFYDDREWRNGRLEVRMTDGGDGSLTSVIGDSVLFAKLRSFSLGTQELLWPLNFGLSCRFV
ncbi:MAG: hypothetical protein U0236_21740 [Nitrospira sp.]